MKKLLSLLLAACLLASLAPGVLAAGSGGGSAGEAQPTEYTLPEPRDVSASGDCTDTVHWKLENGVLTVYGSGAIPDYNKQIDLENYKDHLVYKNVSPWDEYETDVTEIRVESGITEIGVRAFGGLANAKKATVAGTVKVVKASAFDQALLLTEIVLTEGVERIEDYAFAETQIRKLVLPASLRVLTPDALRDMDGLETITVQPGNPVYSAIDGVLFTDGGRTLVHYPWLHGSVYAVPEGTVCIGYEAFFRTDMLTRVTLPGSVREIGLGAFAECINLEEINLPEGVEALREGAFINDWRLKDLYLPSTMTRIGHWAVSPEVTTLHMEKCPDLKQLSDGSYALDPRMRFGDLAADAWYADAVAWAVWDNVTNGTSETTFSPESPCTRAQVVTLLWRAVGSPEPKGSVSFADVQPGSYYEKAVCWAVENGITNGVDATHFAPESPCTRAQVVTLLHRWCEEQNAVPVQTFEDVSDTDWFAKAVNWAVCVQITNGMDETHFVPDGVCTRAQIVTFLFRAKNAGRL